MKAGDRIIAISRYEHGIFGTFLKDSPNGYVWVHLPERVGEEVQAWPREQVIPRPGDQQ